MKKDEAERAIRHLCHVWAKERGFDLAKYSSLDFHPSFGDFTRWLEMKGYGNYLTFRSVRGPRADAEDWFDQEFKQTWRN